MSLVSYLTERQAALMASKLAPLRNKPLGATVKQRRSAICVFAPSFDEAADPFAMLNTVVVLRVMWNLQPGVVTRDVAPVTRIAWRSSIYSVLVPHRLTVATQADVQTIVILHHASVRRRSFGRCCLKKVSSKRLVVRVAQFPA